MGDVQFDGTQEEWDALVKKNKSKSITAVEWLVEMLIDNKYLIKDATHLFEQAKQIEMKKEFETKVYWFGRGILAGRENRIEELQPKTYENK